MARPHHTSIYRPCGAGLEEVVCATIRQAAYGHVTLNLPWHPGDESWVGGSFIGKPQSKSIDSGPGQGTRASGPEPGGEGGSTGEAVKTL